ncbi:hypothetical protein [Geovibrio ferrireducens]|uniref:hypothetical protein n=1 Tax=Geovibrio ferrireducens TaxID=46201 RepID=UPI0022467310|nr:hypothetical protein [Geovibrio ferrireducens]
MKYSDTEQIFNKLYEEVNISKIHFKHARSNLALFFSALSFILLITTFILVYLYNEKQYLWLIFLSLIFVLISIYFSKRKILKKYNIKTPFFDKDLLEIRSFLFMKFAKKHGKNLFDRVFLGAFIELHESKSATDLTSNIKDNAVIIFQVSLILITYEAIVSSFPVWLNLLVFYLLLVLVFYSYLFYELFNQTKSFNTKVHFIKKYIILNEKD